MSAVAVYHLSRLRWLSLKIVPVVTENWCLQSTQKYRMRAGTPFCSSSPVFGFLRCRLPSFFRYFVTFALSHLRQRTPSGHRIDSRKSLQVSGVANFLETSIRFIPATTSYSMAYIPDVVKYTITVRFARRGCGAKRVGNT